MQECRFNHVIVIGYGVVTGEVLRIVHGMALKKGYTEEYIEHEIYPFNSAKKYAEAEKIAYHVIEDRKELLEYFRNAVKRKTLIISAGNNYLFPGELIADDNVTIINFHNALLPDLPGRNAPSWAIYEDRKYTGITWHYVTTRIDAGDIIIQRRCEIDNDMRAYELVAKQMKLASEAFRECYESVLSEDVMPIRQFITEDRRIYKSYEVPADGIFELSSSGKDIYRLLRAMDYGKNLVFPLPQTQLDDQMIRIRRYKKVKKEEIKQQQDRVFIPIDEDYALMLRYDVVESGGKIRGD